MTLHVPIDAQQWDERRNTSRQQPVDPQALGEALRSCAALRKSDPALVQWLRDGHPTLTEQEHYARFGKPYERHAKRSR